MIIKLKNCFVNIKNEDEYFKQIILALKRKQKRTFFYLNSYSFFLANKNPRFKDALNQADFITADGYSIVWFIKHIHNIKIDKVAFTYSFLKSLSKIFNENNTKIYLFGGSQTAIEKSANILKEQYNNLNIVGYSNGFFDIDKDTDNIIKKINDSNTEVLICGMGMPKTEVWIQNNFNKLNAICIFSVGGFFDFISGEKELAPKWMFNSGIEWIYRLLQEPKRLLRRYLNSNTYFILYTVKALIKNDLKQN